jgi:PH (Pleckstrin Homology) domain-containing protein
VPAEPPQMRRSDDEPGQLAQAQSQAFAVNGDDTAVMPRAAAAAAIPADGGAPPAELAGLLLPTESVTFASSPHPIVFAGPLVHFAVTAVALLVVLGWTLHPIVRGHHVTVPLVAGPVRIAVVVVGALLMLRALVALGAAALHYFGSRIVTTNRRVFLVKGIFGRQVTPVGNTALAGATMSQGPLGRMLGYGNIFMPLASSAPSAIRDMRDPVRLYREFEAVANGVEGDTWKMALRQTQLP